MATIGSDLGRASRELSRAGLLLLHDAELVSLSTLVAGAPIRGSWWGHAKGREIFRVAGELGDLEDVLTAKLVGGKVTFVHRRLWPSLLAVVTSGEPWQTNRLPAASSRLLERLHQVPRLRCDDAETTAAAKPIDQRLLARAEQVHGDSGRHVLELEDWRRWARRLRVEPVRGLPEAKAELERAARSLGPSARLPWERGRAPGAALR